MIKVTRLDGAPFVLNAEWIRYVESRPDTFITLVQGDRVVVRRHRSLEDPERTGVLRRGRVVAADQREQRDEEGREAAGRGEHGGGRGGGTTSPTCQYCAPAVPASMPLRGHPGEPAPRRGVPRPQRRA